MTGHPVSAAFECEIRDTQAHTSADDPSADAEFTVIEDTLAGDWTTVRDVTIYVVDDHDVAFDVTVESTAPDDGDFTAVTSEGTVSLSAGASGGKVVPAGVVGRLRLSFAAPGSAPASGSCRVTIHGRR